ncbi:hypothetical protein MMC11_001864 [Xylographa trunciseda]|nr:hypothetical protein [Xylographa trunciseda]
MAGLRLQSKVDGGKSRSTAKNKKGRSHDKISALSTEYIVDSDSDAPVGDAASATKARGTPKNLEQASSQLSLTKGSSKPASKSTLPTKRKSPDSNEEPPAANKKVKVSGSGGHPAESIKAVERKFAQTVPTRTHSSPPTHLGKKVTALATNGSTKPNLTPNGSSKPGVAVKKIPQTRSPAGSAHRKKVNSASSSDDEESEAERGNTESLTNKLAALKSGAASQTSTKPLKTPILTPKASSQPAKQKDSEALSISSGSGTNGSETEESESESESESDEPNQIQKKVVSKPPLATKPSANLISKYKPPPGFLPASHTTPSSSTSDLATLFSPSNLASKQIWHFTLPASVPMSAIKAVSMDSILKGTSAFTYKHADYAFVSDASCKQATIHLLTPNAKGDEYNAIPRAITRTMHLQQVLRLPDLSTASGKETDESHNSQGTNDANLTTTMLPLQRIVHQQPKGLKMRYTPFGDESNDPTYDGPDSDDEADAERPSQGPAHFRMPAGYEAALPQEVRESDDAGSSQVERQESPKKKRKKHRKERESSSQAPVESQSSIAQSSSQANGHERHPIEETVMNGVSQKHDGETAEEKAKRRTEKATKKQERRKKRAERESASSQVAATQ